MTKWLIIITLAATLGIFGFLYTQSTHQTPTTDTTQTPNGNEIAVVHSFKDGVHQYSGQFKLAHSCYAVTTETQSEQGNPKNQRIIVTVVDNMAHEGFCSQLVTRYPFNVILDAPEDVNTILEVNGSPVPMKIYETGWHNPTAGGYITPINNPGQ